MKPRNQSGKLSQIPIVAFLENFNFNEKDANQNNATRSILVANSRQVFVLKCSLRQGLFTKICVLYIFLQIYVAQNVCFIYMLYQESQLDIFLETKLVLLFSRQNVYSISVSSCGSNNDMILHFFFQIKLTMLLSTIRNVPLERDPSMNSLVRPWVRDLLQL